MWNYSTYISPCRWPNLVIWVGMALGITAGTTYGRVWAEGLKWSVRPVQDSVISGAPVLLSFDLTNDGPESLTVYLWEENRREPLRAELADCNGRVISLSLDPEILPWPTEKGWGLVVPPGGTTSRQAVLNQLCSTRVPPGKYTMRCQVGYVIASERKKQVASQAGGADDTMPMHRVQVEALLQILPADEGEYKSQLISLAQRAERLHAKWPPAGHEGLNAEIASVEMLAFAEGDCAVSYQAAIIREMDWGNYRYYAIMGLQRNGSLAAVRQLEDLAADPNVKLMNGKDDLIRAVYSIRDRGDATIREATDEFIKKYPRPPAPQRAMN
jgi:hypothetical protein